MERAAFFAKVVRQTHALSPVRPGRFVHFVKEARQTPIGPHLALMFHAAAHPDKEALVEYGEHGVRRLTWGELDATINRLAHALLARGVTAGSRVALMLPNGRAYLIAQHALARLGATAVQIGYRLKAAEIAYILGHAEPRATIVHADYLPAMRAARAQLGATGPVIAVGGDGHADVDDWDRALAAAAPTPPLQPRANAGDGGGVILYTSGTTGKAKGAHRTWRDTGFEPVADLVLQVGVRADDRHLVVCPLYHAAAMGFVAMMLGIGSTLVLVDHFDPERALDVIARERVTCTLVVPTMLVRLTGVPAEVRARHDTSSLRWVMSGAAPLPTAVAAEFMRQFGPILWNFYGATETGMVTLAGPADHTARPGTIGRALSGNELRLLDDAGHEVGPGQIGELYARSAMLIGGYHRNAEATRASQRDGFFSVGDLGRRDADGYYYLESRKHDMVISGGVNIYPREIEDHLHTHPAIADVAVVGVPDAEWGEAVHAFVVVRPGHTLDADAVIAFCRAGLADYKRPRHVTFLSELPRNPTGKILKRELRAPGQG